MILFQNSNNDCLYFWDLKITLPAECLRVLFLIFCSLFWYFPVLEFNDYLVCCTWPKSFKYFFNIFFPFCGPYISLMCECEVSEIGGLGLTIDLHSLCRILPLTHTTIHITGISAYSNLDAHSCFLTGFNCWCYYWCFSSYSNIDQNTR